MILVDGAIDKTEMCLASGFAVIFGFKENEIPKLLSLLIRGIKKGKDEDDLFKEYKKEMKIKNRQYVSANFA